MPTRKLELQRRYDLTAHAYDRRYGEIQRRKYGVVLANLPPADSVLDLGCGTGMLLEELSKRSKFAVGADASGKMLNLAKHRNDRAALVRADADHLPFADGCFDAVVSVTLLQNMPDPATTIREIARVIKTGGKVILTTLKRKHTLEELGRWVRNAGLKQMELFGMSDSEDLFCIAEKSLNELVAK